MGKRSRKRSRKQLPDGLHVDVAGDRILLGRTPAPGEVPTVGQAWRPVGYCDFGGVCPLCAVPVSEADLSDEHVPPYSVGGIVRTRTCATCNGRGSRAEAELVRWWAREFRAKLSTDGVQGARAVGDVLFRLTREGKFAIVASGDAAAEVLDAARHGSGTVTVTFFGPSEVWRTALLKSAYLAACVHLGEVPDSPDARWARDTIKSGRFGAGDLVGVGGDAVPFRVFRVTGADPAAVWVGHVMLPWDRGDVPIFGVGLGDVAFVTWPMPDLREHAVRLAAQGYAA
jgi:hypothetical protein